MSGRIVLHIGTQKTGSTSLQHFLHDNRDGVLSPAGITYPPGLVIPTSHTELPLIAIRRDRDWPAALRFPETRTDRWLAGAAARVAENLTAAREEVVVLSHEDLSYVRHDDETARLRGLFGDRPVQVVVFVRAPDEFLRSYRSQLTAMGFPPSDDPTSFAFAEPSSWLVDTEALIATYRRAFDDVVAVEYDRVVAADGSVIPTFAELLGIDRSKLPPLGRYFLNRTGTHLRPDDEHLAVIRRRVEQLAQ